MLEGIQQASSYVLIGAIVSRRRVQLGRRKNSQQSDEVLTSTPMGKVLFTCCRQSNGHHLGQLLASQKLAYLRKVACRGVQPGGSAGRK